jgi:hypothetical protein
VNQNDDMTSREMVSYMVVCLTIALGGVGLALWWTDHIWLVIALVCFAWVAVIVALGKSAP